MPHVVLTPGLHLRRGDAQSCRDGCALARLRRLPPTLDQLRIDAMRVGARPTPRDGFPAVGFAPRVRGLYLTVMHSGITRAPLIGRCAAEESLHGAEKALLVPRVLRASPPELHGGGAPHAAGRLPSISRTASV